MIARSISPWDSTLLWGELSSSEHNDSRRVSDLFQTSQGMTAAVRMSAAAGRPCRKFKKEEDADKAVKDLNNRWFGGRPVYAELTPVTDFREACCRQYETGECTRSGFCNFMHLKPISRKLRSELYGRGRVRGGGTELGPLHMRHGMGDLKDELDQERAGRGGRDDRGGERRRDRSRDRGGDRRRSRSRDRKRGGDREERGESAGSSRVKEERDRSGRY